MPNDSGDVLLFQTLDDGDICIENGLVQMTESFEAAVYLSLFGGNIDGEWWGNRDIDDPVFKQVSRTQSLLMSLPAITSNLVRVQGAVKSDLKWLLDQGIASSVEVVLVMPKLNKIQIAVKIRADGAISEFNFTENWESR